MTSDLQQWKDLASFFSFLCSCIEYVSQWWSNLLHLYRYHSETNIEITHLIIEHMIIVPAMNSCASSLDGSVT